MPLSLLLAAALGTPLRYELRDYEPAADPAATIIVGAARFTILTSRLIRIEYDASGAFEDRATLAFVNRRLDVPDFTWDAARGVLTTSALTLTYTGGAFTPDSLRVDPRPGSPFAHADAFGGWRFGMTSAADAGNLRGTYRTLDGTDNATLDCNSRDGARGRDHCEWGVVSRSGWALVNETGVPCLDAQHDWWADGAGKMLRNRDEHDLYLFAHGRDYAGAIADLVAAGGDVPLLPRRSLGVWFTRWYDYDAADAVGLLNEFESRSLPLDILILDMNWHSKQSWTGYSWDRNLFPEPHDALGRIHARGVAVGANLHDAEGVGPWEDSYAAVAERMGTPKGKAVPLDLVNVSYVFALEDEVLRPVEESGVDFWWIDWQQGEDKGRTGQDGRPDGKMNPTIWTAKTRVTDHKRRCKLGLGCTHKRGVTFARWGGLGQHRYQHGFSGDVREMSWADLAFQTYFSATAANVAFGFWSHDLMGPGDNPEMYARWLQLGVYSPIFRLHDRGQSAGDCAGWPTHEDRCAVVRPWREPGAFYDANRAALRRRAELLPYIYTHARAAHETGLGLLRPMYYAWPDEDRAYPASPDANLGQEPSTRQYMFGDSLLVAPVTRPSKCIPRPPATGPCGLAEQKVWLPPGSWYELHTGTLRRGAVEFAQAVHIDDVPVYARAGAVVPTRALPHGALIGGAAHVSPDLIWTIYPGAQSGNGHVYEDDGESEEYLRGAYTRTALAYTWHDLDGASVHVARLSHTRGGESVHAARTRGGTLTIEIAAVDGPATWRDGASSRAHTIRLPGSRPPRAVRFAGEPLRYSRSGGAGTWSYDGADLATVIELGAAPLAAKLVVEVDVGAAALGGPISVTGGAADGAAGLITASRRAKALLDEVRFNPGAQQPDPRGSPLDHAAIAADRLGYLAGVGGGRFDSVLANVSTWCADALAELMCAL